MVIFYLILPICSMLQLASNDFLKIQICFLSTMGSKLSGQQVLAEK